MMSGFRGGGGGGGSRTGRRNNYNSGDVPLIKLVEDYLFQHKHLSFINLEHMGEVIRGKSFRFSRMKQSTFKEQLRRAYQQYTDNANRSMDEFSGADIQLDNAPLTDETLKEMSGYPSESDSDLEIDESPCNVTKDAGVDQMKNLYKTPGSSNSNNESNNAPNHDHKVPDNSKASSGLVESPIQISGNADKSDCISVGSSTDLSSRSENMRVKSVISISEKVVSQDAANNGNDSESDLEIIEEVQNERPHNSVITNGSARAPLLPLPTQAGSTEPQQMPDSGPKTTSPTGRKETRTVSVKVNESSNLKTRVGPNTEPQTQKKVEPPARGTKRKTEDETPGGINDDMTRKRPRKEVTVIHDTGYKLQDFAGSDKVVEEICKLLMHLKHPEVYQTLGVTPPRGFLLHGPPGTGKTLLANAIAGELQTPLLKVAGTELVSGISGESESNIRELFNQAVAIAPCIIFIDEIDSVTPRRENVNKEMERRIVAQLLACIDDLVNKEKGSQVLLIGATNRIEAIDTALRRAGRFDREICLGIPDERSREKILSVICRDLKVETGFQIGNLARLTPGYVGADLKALVREAAVQAVNRKLLSEPEPTDNSQQIDTSSTPMEVDSEPASGETVESTELQNSGAIAEASDVESSIKADTEISSEVSSEPKPEVSTEEKSVENTEEAKTSENMSEVKTDESSSETQQEKILDIANCIDKPVSNPMRWIKETAPLTANELEDLFVTMKDFTFALKNVQPSSKREGFATVPDTTWEDIGALQNIRDELQVSILGPVKHAEAFKQLGLNTPAGVLLCGPPGCGKTLLAKAVANEAGINFISVKGPELLNMYVGESERAVRQCFLRARNSSPCVIFFDELDALCPRRSDVADGGSSGRIVNQLLTEMDGIESRQGVYVMAASNRPDIIDPAVLRPGRLDKILFVNLPTANERLDILRTITKSGTKPVLADDVNLEEIANCPECDDYTGADLAALVREASIASFRELVMKPEDANQASCSTSKLKVYARHFEVAFTKTKPSVGKDDRLKYKMMAEKYSSIR